MTSPLTKELTSDLTFFRKDNLVYTYVLKNASTYYSTLFEYNNWKRIQLKDIDSFKDHVFGFIMNPLSRYFKGLTEDISNNNINNTEEFFKNNSQNIVNNEFILLSGHCIPISLTYIDFYNEIDWIPLDIEIEPNYFLEKLLKHYNIEFEFGDVFGYKSLPEKIELCNELENKFNNNDILHKLLHKDILLYEDVIKNFNPNGNDWDSISWLKKSQ